MKTNNRYIIITGTQYVDRPDQSLPRSTREDSETIIENQVAFGYRNLEITVNGISKPLSKDNDKFIICSANFETAREEFYARWNIFCARTFNRRVTIITK